ncbi:glycosyltransferase family 4 protein [Glaciimonas sp. CA11.2]|nr:glycosyltransferase family 4 protein [Glaciimonas sp. CA11.2]MEB0163397.1 glycosyltransferase family 4 protein [Glaciimonas sp. CA11.2]
MDGQNVHIEEMIGALRALGHEVIIVAPLSAKMDAFGADSGLMSWFKRHLPKFVYELMELAYSLVAYRQLAQAIRLHKPDCLYERYNLLLLSGIWIKRKYRLPMLLEINAPIFEERAHYDGLSLKWLARWSQTYVWRGADYVLPVTGVLADIVASYGVDRSRILVIPNGINVDRFDQTMDPQVAKTALGLQDKMVLGFTGFVRDWHGLDKVIAMLALGGEGAEDTLTSNRHLLVVGDGPARAQLEHQAAMLNISDRITFTGVVNRDQVARYVAAFDIALQPAVVAYASPLKLFEYLALGKAIVGPDQPNITEILTDGYNAVLFDPDHTDGLPVAIERLCADIGLRHEVGGNARRTIADQGLTWNANAVRVAKLFKSMLVYA